MVARMLRFAALLMLASASAALAGSVTMDRMLREHKIYVVTNAQPGTLDKYWLDWRPEKIVTMSLSELVMNKNRLEDGGFVFFVLDRSRMRKPVPEEEELLPSSSPSIGPAQVLVYASKSGNKRSSARQNKWDVMISAPNSKWLQAEMDRLTSAGLLYKPLDERGIVLDRYDIKRMCIVSTEGRQLAEEWVGRQSVPGRDAIDWEFVPWGSWDPGVDNGVDVLFMLSKDSLKKSARGLPTMLPDGIRSWLENGTSDAEFAAEKRIADLRDGDERTVAVVAAPCVRQLAAALEKHSSLNWVPESIERHKLSDLSGFAQVVVVGRPSDRSNDSNAALIDDLAAKITSALASPEVGFACRSRQDLKELIYESLRRGQDSIAPSDAGRIMADIGVNCGLAVVDLAAVDLTTEYSANPSRRLTDPYPEFPHPRPSEPARPDPHARRYGLFGPHIYPKGDDDPKYWRDLREWEDHLYPEYEHELHLWQREREEYESRRHYHDMEWVRSVQSVQSARVTGNLRIYDLSSFNRDGTNTGKVIFSCPISGSCERRSEYSSERVVVRGETSQPGAPEVPGSEQTVEDLTVISQALQSACADAVRQVADSSILPRDRAATAIASNTDQPGATQ